MSSYKKHILLSLILTFPFFPDVYYLSLAVIGASLVDLDSKYRNKNLIILGLSGCLLSLLLQFLNFPIFPGLILVTLSLIFFISKHRGLMHSFIGIIFGALLLGIFTLSLLMLLQFLHLFYYKAILFLTSAFLGIMILNKKLVIPYILVLSMGILLTPLIGFNVYFVFGSVILGSLSHLILDLFTPSGVKIFKPFSSRRMGKMTGMILLAIWFAAIILFYGFNFISSFI
jgi:inner membrane protein